MKKTPFRPHFKAPGTDHAPKFRHVAWLLLATVGTIALLPFGVLWAVGRAVFGDPQPLQAIQGKKFEDGVDNPEAV